MHRAGEGNRALTILEGTRALRPLEGVIGIGGAVQIPAAVSDAAANVVAEGIAHAPSEVCAGDLTICGCGRCFVRCLNGNLLGHGHRGADGLGGVLRDAAEGATLTAIRVCSRGGAVMGMGGTAAAIVHGTAKVRAANTRIRVIT